MADQLILSFCETEIVRVLGNLDDLPYELANTVANVYYKYFEYMTDVMIRSNDNPNWIPKEFEETNDLAEGMESLLKNYATMTINIKTLPRYIECLRKIDKSKEPDEYKYIVESVLDQMKYGIDLGNKSGIRIMIERNLRKSKVQEIPNLVDLLNLSQIINTPSTSTEQETLQVDDSTVKIEEQNDFDEHMEEWEIFTGEDNPIDSLEFDDEEDFAVPF